MNIIIVGDYCDNCRSSEYIRAQRYENLFGKIKPIIEKADIAIANFEFPIVTKHSCPIDKTGPHLGGCIQSIEAIKYAGFNVLTLANNHILDHGERCCIETKQYIEESGIRTVGVGVNLEDANKVLYITKKEKTIAIISCCEHEFSLADHDSIGANPLDTIRIYNNIQEAKCKADFVLVIVHGGIEHFQYPTVRMKETYQFFVGIGADAVVNHHQHCYSGYEFFNGKPIFYGLGNFHFDFEKKRNCIWNYGYAVNLDTDNPRNCLIIPYEQNNEIVGTIPLEEDTSKAFFDELRRINEIIQDNKLLEAKKKEYVFSTSLEFQYMLSPYTEKHLNSLYIKGFLPDLRDKNRWLRLLNAIQCESHRERIIDYIKLKIDN